MNIGIVGWGVEGQSAYKYYGPKHNYLIVNEAPRVDFPPESERIKLQFLPAKPPAGMVSLVDDLSYLEGIDKCNLIFYQPTAYKNLRKFFGDDKAFWGKTITAQHIFFEEVKTKNIIGVTGTKGKGTTSTLIYKLLNAAGKTTHFGGNVGKSVLDLLPQVKPDDWVVLELSSFQLHEFPYSPHIGVVLMITPEHLDWHANLDEYLDAKSNLFAHQKPDDIAVYFANNEYSRRIAGTSQGRKIPYFAPPGARLREDGMIVIGQDEQEVMHRSEVKLLGEHNLQNICAALTAAQEALGSLDSAKTVLHSFSGLEHRLEHVRELEGVNYYDDSFGTTPDTAIVAMHAFDQPKVMILGGSDKGVPFSSLVEEVLRSNVRHVVAIGKTGPLIAMLLRTKGYKDITEGPEKMADIVAAARKAAQPGDTVLLSTGCASFGLFKDYRDRGSQFKQAVLKLS